MIKSRAVNINVLTHVINLETITRLKKINARLIATRDSGRVCPCIQSVVCVATGVVTRPLKFEDYVCIKIMVEILKIHTELM